MQFPDSELALIQGLVETELDVLAMFAKKAPDIKFTLHRASVVQLGLRAETLLADRQKAAAAELAGKNKIVEDVKPEEEEVD